MQIFISLFAVFIALGFCFFLFIKEGRSFRFLAMAALLLLYCLLEVFDLLVYLNLQELFFWKRFSLVCEGLLPFVTLLFSLTFYRSSGLRNAGWFSRVFLVLAPLFLLLIIIVDPEKIIFSPDFAEEKILFLGQWGFFFYIGIMVYLTLSLVMLERTLMSLAVHERWSIKFEIIGVGILLASSLIFYSQSLLYRSLDMNLLLTRSLALLIAVALIIFSRIKRGGGSPIAVSRGVAFQSVVVLALSLYLVGLGLLGEGMRYLDVSFQKNFFIIIGMLSGLAVLVVFLSENLRRKINVFLQKNFFRNKFDYRRQWLEFTRRISGAASYEQLQRMILTFFCETFGFVGATLYLKDDTSGDYVRATRFRIGADQAVFSKDNVLVCYLEKRDWIFNVADQEAEVMSGNEAFFADYEVSLMVPLRFAEKLEGFVVCGRLINSGENFTYEDFDLLRVLARQTTSAIITRRLSEELLASRELVAMGKVSAFVMHDLKNQVSSLSLMVENAADYIADPEFQEDMLETLTGTIDKMKNLIARLKNLREKPELNLTEVDLLEIAERVIRNLGREVELVKDGPVLVRADREELATVLLNLLLNAFDAGLENQLVVVTVGLGEVGEPCFKVSDQGCGMSVDFIENRLFRPFSTTKKKGLGIGLYQCKQIIEAHGGRIEVESELGVGTVFTVKL
ncbi:MAG: XrtA/PEP-CTERM system histidine kinase PrsK [Pseudomonadota bacterium]|nr:XrtA/PEP-CTERM system histidine kinase PrsK [Pseudomonadota bacterium]